MKIDTSTIAGFAEMTAEQKVEALLGLEVPDKVDLSGYVEKKVFDAKASEAADLSKKLKAHLSDEEKARAAADEAKSAADQAKAAADQEIKDLKDKYTELLRKSTIADHTARYLAMPGYDEKLARETAEALADGDMNKVFENQQKASENHEKKLKAELLKNTPKPEAASTVTEVIDTKDANVKLAESLGKARAASKKASEDALKYYM